MKKTTSIGLAAVALIAGGVWALSLKPGESTPAPASPSASMSTAAISTDGKQVFEIAVREGYEPKAITAKAGVPLVLKMKTAGTFDCSSTFTVPKLGIRLQLPPTGETSIDIPAQKAGDSVNGVCGMGMFTLVINFT